MADMYKAIQNLNSVGFNSTHFESNCTAALFSPIRASMCMVIFRCCSIVLPSSFAVSVCTIDSPSIDVLSCSLLLIWNENIIVYWVLLELSGIKIRRLRPELSRTVISILECSVVWFAYLRIFFCRFEVVYVDFPQIWTTYCSLWPSDSCASDRWKTFAWFQVVGSAR